MTRRPRSSILAHPLLLGAVVLLVAVYGVYVSYEANKGLPFVPRYHVDVELPNASQIVKGADVTIAGARIGQVLRVRPQPRPGRAPVALLELSLDKQQQPIAADSTVVVRTSGSLGRKFLDITPGRSARGVPDGGTLPVTQARPQAVEVDQLLNTFRPAVRTGVARSLGALGPGFAARGAGVNAALGAFPPLLGHLRPVMANLAAGRTGLDRFLRAWEDAAGELVPVAGTLPGLAAGLDTTFGALARTAPALQAALTESPATLDAGLRGLPQTATLLRESTALLRELRPGARFLPSAAPHLASAFGAGARTLPGVPALARRVDPALTGVAAFSERPVVRGGVSRVTLTAGTLSPLVSFLAPVQTTCNYMALAVRNLASLFKEGVATGTTVRAGGVVVGVDRNSERGPSDAPYAGKAAKALGPLHSNPYPNTASPGQPHECEAGNEPYISNQVVVGNVPGLQKATTEAATLP